jgi:hypothetical protein
VAATSHAHLGPTIEQVRGLASLTVLKVEVADVQVSQLDGYTGGAKTVLVVRGDLTFSTDLSRARFSSQDSFQRTAVLVLPPPQVTSPRVDHERTRIVGVWEYGLWRIAPGDAAEAALIDQAYAEAQAVVAAAGQEPPLDARARQQAESVLVTFFQSLGWTLTVHWSDREQTSGGGTIRQSTGGALVASDQTVTARHVLQSLTRTKRQGLQTAMAELEKLEPDLAGYLMEELSLLHQKLYELGAPAARTRWLVRRTESLMLVCIGALRLAHADLWRREVGIGGEEAPTTTLVPPAGEANPNVHHDRRSTPPEPRAADGTASADS